MVKMQDLLGSRRFWVAVSSVLFVVGKDGMGLNITEDQVWMIVGLLSSWIVSDGLRKT